MKMTDCRSVTRHLAQVFLAGCALVLCSVTYAADTEVPTDTVPQNDTKPGPLGLAVGGASGGIKADYFEQTVTAAIRARELCSGIDSSKKAELVIRMINVEGAFPDTEISSDTPYALKIRIIKVDAPSFSIRMTVSMDVVWTLYRTADKAVLLQEIISSTYTGGAFEGGIIGANRVRAGTEGAARENIRIGMQMLEALEIK